MVPPSPRKDASYSLWRSASVKIDKVRRVSLSDWQGDCRAQRQGSVFVARAVVRNLCFLGGSGGLGALSGSGEERGRREAANSEISKRKKKDEERCERHISPNLLLVIPRGREAIRHALAVQFQLLIEIQERWNANLIFIKVISNTHFPYSWLHELHFFSYKCQSNDVGHAGSTIKAFCLCMVKPGRRKGWRVSVGTYTPSVNCPQLLKW